MKKSNLLTLSFLFICGLTFSQKRIGFDASTRLSNVNFTFHYQQVIKNNWLFGAGIFGGGNGTELITNDTLGLYDNSIQSAYASVDQPFVDTNNVSYGILDYLSKGRSLGVQAGVGYFHEFDSKHGLRANLYGKIGYASNKVRGYYRSIENFTEKTRNNYVSHWIGGVSLELAHTVRLSGRNTFYYGVKAPFYFSLDRAKFNPQSYQDIYYGVEPEFTFGFTRVIGKCD